MDRYNWEHIAEEQLGALLSRRVIHTGGATVARIRLAKGAVVPLHQHPNEQITTVVSGVLDFDIAGEIFTLKAGDVLVVPPHAPHRVEALEDSMATDYFTPAREDWIRGDDAYLRR